VRKAFTIVELIVSIALVLVLMVGVSQVFRTISSTVSAGSSVSDNTRIARAAQKTFADDFGMTVTKDAPCLLLHSSYRPAFRNSPDMLGDRDADPLTSDIDGDNIENDPARPAFPNYRIHRTDSLSFFSRGLVKRQTGGSVADSATPLIADQTAAESFVWYGHLRLPNNDTVPVYQPPGVGTLGNNANNYFASQWILGRQQILLREPDGDPPAMRDRFNEPQIYIQGTGSLSPLGWGSRSSGGGSFTIQQSRFDIANTTMNGFRQKLETFIDANPTAPWWQELFSGSTRRFEANPFLVKPVDAAKIAQQAPIFIPGCTQFIIEFAGDYVEQDRNPQSATYGQVVNVLYPSVTSGASATDGEIDFIVIGTGVTRRKVIRWYGSPRDVDGNGLVPSHQTGRTNNDLTDVVPLRDVMRTLPAEASNPGAPWEKDLTTLLPVAPSGDYASMPVTNEYNCAFRGTDRMPKMIRITLVIDDPAGRNPNQDGAVFEYVFELP
jgi:type II secretory pathway pseudopilin PulG